MFSTDNGKWSSLHERHKKKSHEFCEMIQSTQLNWVELKEDYMNKMRYQHMLTNSHNKGTLLSQTWSGWSKQAKKKSKVKREKEQKKKFKTKRVKSAKSRFDVVLAHNM